MTTIVSVTPTDIAQGKRFSRIKCALALAMTRAFGQPVSVGATVWDFSDKGNLCRNLPDKAIDFRDAFDMGRTVEPFVFEIDDAA